MIPQPFFGIDKLLADKEKMQALLGCNVAVLTNQTTLTHEGIPSAYALSQALGGTLKMILTPEHGWSGKVAEGLKVESSHAQELDLPIISLYGGGESLRNVLHTYQLTDIIIDLQDMGLRCYTYVTTCAKLLEACSGRPLKVWICDRPNPLGTVEQGPLLDPAHRSFLAYLNIPFQHGKTMGKLLQDFNETLGDGRVDLEILSCPPFHAPYAYAWYPPSPNLPSWEAALLYPALVLLEGVNVSEGRGTSYPFTCLGAPGLNSKKLVEFLNGLPNTGVRAEPLVFTPESGKLKGHECQGAHLFVEDYSKLNAFSLGLSMLGFLKQIYSAFEWTPCSSDQGNSGYFIDALLGTSAIREQIEKEQNHH